MNLNRPSVLGGDRDEPAGPFNEALDLIETGKLQKHGITRVVFACFPEGHARISDAALQGALEAKLPQPCVAGSMSFLSASSCSTRAHCSLTPSVYVRGAS